MIKLTKGTIEYIVVNVKDRLSHLITLDGSDPTFDVKKRGAEDLEVENEDAINEGMNVLCLVDTTDLDVDIYELFVSFENFPEQPKLGPFAFEVS